MRKLHAHRGVWCEHFKSSKAKVTEWVNTSLSALLAAAHLKTDWKELNTDQISKLRFSTEPSLDGCGTKKNSSLSLADVII